jgi:hypothetical protein
MISQISITENNDKGTRPSKYSLLTWSVVKRKRRHIVNSYHVRQNSSWKRRHRHLGGSKGANKRATWG